MGWKETALGHGGLLGGGPSRASGRRYSYWLGLATVAAAYVASAKFGIGLSVAHGVITPVWAPTGIALAALLLFGPRMWPAVALGALIANGTSGAEPAVAAGIAVGNTLEAVAGAYLLRKIGFRTNLERVRDVLLFVLLGAGVSTLISATNGTTVLVLAGGPLSSYGSDWLLWWFGDAVGALMVAPLLLVAFSLQRRRLGRAELLEAAVLFACLGAVSALVFLGDAWHYPYLIFPFLLWAVLRFRQFGAAASSLLVGAIGTWGTVAGTVPIAPTSATERVQILQALLGVVAISLLVLGATLSERERASQDLKRTTASLIEAQALAHIGSWEWDVARNHVAWSDELYRMSGLDPGRFGASYEAYLATVHPGDRDSVDAAVHRALETGGFDHEFRMVRSDGVEHFIRGRGKVVADEAGRPLKMIGTDQDITEQKRIDAERERFLDRERAQTARLRELDRMKDIFLASVSHELRTPLTSIIGFIDLLRDETTAELTDEQRRYLEIASRNTERLDRLVGDLLLVAQADAGEALLKPTRVDLRALAAECVESVHPRAAEADVTMVLASDELPAVTGDRARLAQLLDNLVSNAIKFSSRGGRVLLRLYAENGHVVLEVADNGIGIPAAEKPQVFERFFRSSNAAERAIQGTGLGLSIAKMIVEAHGGSISFQSEEGEGTTFRVEIPLAADSAHGLADDAEAA
jgi:signal transduction histidine kinase